MVDFLNKIDDYIRKNGIPFREIEISDSFLPEEFNYAILYKLRDVNCDIFDKMWPNKYVLSYDKDNYLRLIATGEDERTRIIIYSSSVYDYIDRKGELGFKVSDGSLYKLGCVSNYNIAIRKRIINTLNETYRYSPISEKLKRLHSLMKDINEDTFASVSNYDIYTKGGYADKMNMSTEMIISYIEYLNTCYKESLLEQDRDRMCSINYLVADSEPSIKKNDSTSIGYGSRERVNPVIPGEERFNILHSFDFDYYCLASSSDNKIDYYCYLYRSFDNYPILVLEPYSGTNWTRVIFLERRDYSKEEFASLCKKYLELSNRDTYLSDRIIKFNHTDSDTFYGNLGLLVSGNSNNVDYRKSTKVRKIKNNLL